MLSRRGGYLAAHSEVRQRVLSARRLRIKTFQNQLADAQQTISDLAHENRLLRSLHKRQDSALAKYESNNAELPQLLHSHAEELRVWQTKYRNLQNAHKDLESKLKQKEREMLALSDENKYYIQLSKDKHLDERQRLKDKVAALESRLQAKDNEMQLLVRKLKLYAKNHKLALQAEQKKVKEMMGKLEKARMELSGYSKLEEINFMQCKLPGGPKPLRKKLLRSEDGSVLKTPEELFKLETVLEKNGGSSCENSLFEDTEGSQAGSTRTPKSSCTVREASKKISTTTVTIGQQTSGSTTMLAPPKAVPKQRRIDIGDGDAPSCEAKKMADPPKGPKVYSPVPAKRHPSPPPPVAESRKLDRRDTPRIRAPGGDGGHSVIYTEDESLYGGGGGDDEEPFSDGDDEEEEDDDDDDEDDVQVGGLAPQMYGDGDHEKSEDLSNRSESYGCGSAGSVANSPSPFRHDEGDGDGVDEEAFIKFKRLAAKESMVYLLETGHTADKEPKKGSNNNNNNKSSKGKPEPVKMSSDYSKAQPAKAEPRSRPISGAGFKSEISNIRKQISDDYKEREAFLDTFCRQAGSGGALQDEPPPMPKKRNSIALGRNIPPNRKHKLLAALKAIDDNRSQE